MRQLFWSPGGRGDHPTITGHVVRVPSRNMGTTMCKQFITPGVAPACYTDDTLPRGWNCHEMLHGNPYNHDA